MIQLLLHAATALAGPTMPAAYLPKTPQFAAPRVCAPVDFRRRLGPARVMGQNGYCFAYSSAVLVSQRTGRDASALDLVTGFYLAPAAKFNQMISPAVRAELDPDLPHLLALEKYAEGVDVDGPLAILPRLEGGFEPSALLWVNARGICEDKDLPSEGGTDAYAPRIREFIDLARRERGPAAAAAEGISPRFRGATNDRFHAAWLNFTRSSCRSRPSPVDILPVDFGIANTSRGFARARREGRVRESDQTRVLEALDFALDHERAATIGFDLNTVQSHRGYIDDDGDHSVAIVGRRAVGGECQYLVRDSAGDPCSTFTPEVRARCTPREYWLNEEELRRSLYSVTYLR